MTPEPRPAEKRIPPIVKSLGWVSFFTDAASEMIYPLLPALLKSFGAAPIWLGSMEGIAEAVSAGVKWRMGEVTDKAPRKKPFIVAGYVLATFARPLIALATAGLHVVLLRTLDRLGKGIRGVPRDALVAASVEEKHMATAFAFHRAMDNAGSVLGPILAFVLLRLAALPIRTVIALAVVPGLVSLAVLVLGVREAPHEDALVDGGGKSDERDTPERAPVAPLSPLVRRYLAVLAVFTLGASADSFLLLRAVDVGVPEAYVPLLWLVLSGVKALSNVPGGRIADRIGRKRTVALGWTAYALVYAAIPFVPGTLPFVALVVAYGAYYGLTEGPERALLVSLTPASSRGRALGGMHAVTGLAVLPANLLFGALYGTDPRLAFLVSAGCALVATALLISMVPVPAPPVTRDAS